MAKIIIISAENQSAAQSVKVINPENNTDESIIKATLKKLLAANIEANSFSGFSRFFKTRSPDLPFFFSFCLSVSFSEKYATSEPLKSAETNRNITLKNNQKKTLVVNGWN